MSDIVTSCYLMRCFMELSFGEQIKILLNRKNMTIQELADLYEQTTGSKMSRQNLAQRLKRDNFPEQDMRSFAALLGYNVSIQLTPIAIPAAFPEPVPTLSPEAMQAFQIPRTAESAIPPLEEVFIEPDIEDEEPLPESAFEIPEFFRKKKSMGEINPLTGQEYLTNTVRRHPYIEDYIQVYDRSTHSWSDVEENYFWEFQRNKKQMLGSEYQEPVLI